ncbi:MAG: hypothetical protein RL662_428 [Bacteroidota bacterium]|jgi:hypothetical protein
MAALEIQCYLDECQMRALTDYVSVRLYKTHPDCLQDIDTCFDTLPVRLCVEFEIASASVQLKQAEVLDEDWQTIDADSAVLRSRLRNMLNTYNHSENQLMQNARNIRIEQIQNTLCNS